MEETVNKNIEKYQTPNWRAHPSMLGWCQMNYPSYIVDKRQKREPSPREETHDLSFIHQQRNTTTSHNSQLYKPFSSVSKDKAIVRKEGVGSPPKGFKASVYTLTTTPLENRIFLKEEMAKDADLSRVGPLSCEIGHRDFTEKFEKKIPQVGEIKYFEEPDEELMRHYKSLPSSIITEQSLKEMLSENLQKLNLSNLKWVKNEHLNKLGFLSPNLIDLNISGTCANASTLEEIGGTLINLRLIDISNCQELTEKGVACFFDNCPELHKFWAANCNKSVTDHSLAHFTQSHELVSFNIEFCNQVSQESFNVIIEAAPPLKELYISGCTKLSGKAVTALIEKSKFQLEIAELSNLTQPEFDNETMKAVGTCIKLKRLNISGDSLLGDDAIHNLIIGLKEADDTLMKKEEGLKNLVEFRMSSTKVNSEGAILKFCNACPNLEILDLNGFVSLGETSLNMICKALPKLKLVMLNYTNNISDAYLTEIIQTYSHIKFIRTIVTNSDPTDNALRVPFPKIQTGKKKKKKGKKKK